MWGRPVRVPTPYPQTMYRPAFGPARPQQHQAGPSTTNSSALRFQPATFAPNARVAAALLPALAMVVGPADRSVLGLVLVSVHGCV